MSETSIETVAEKTATEVAAHETNGHAKKPVKVAKKKTGKRKTFLPQLGEILSAGKKKAAKIPTVKDATLKKTEKPKKEKTAPKSKDGLRVPQYRALKALMPNGKYTPALTRIKLAKACGFSPIAGTINRALRGIAKNAKQSGYAGAHKGLLQLNYVKQIENSLDGGLTETVYQITPAGVKACKAFAADHKTVKRRSAEASINHRYTKKGKKGK